MKYIFARKVYFAFSVSPNTRYNENFILDLSEFAIHDSPLCFEISEDDHP